MYPSFLITLLLFPSLVICTTPIIAAYWGQNSVASTYPADQTKWEQPLDTYCDGTYEIIMLSFLNMFFDAGANNGPNLNFANHCETTFSGSTLLSCPDIGTAGKTCQSKGTKIFLSLGGAAGTYGFTSADQAVAFAGTIWDMFGAGTTTNRPFGDFIIDGIDLDIEGGNSAYYANFVNELVQNQFTKDTSKKYYISGAPQCPYPDAYLGPGGSTALETSKFDYIFVQFYNNYCGVSGSNFNFDTWNTWAKTSLNPDVKVLVGAPASTAAGAGYIGTAELAVLVATISSASNFGGVMLWETSTALANSNFGGVIAKAIGAASTLLGGSSGDTSSSTTSTSTSSSPTDTSGSTSSPAAGESSAPVSGSTAPSTGSTAPSTGSTNTGSGSVSNPPTSGGSAPTSAGSAPSTGSSPTSLTPAGSVSSQQGSGSAIGNGAGSTAQSTNPNSQASTNTGQSSIGNSAASQPDPSTSTNTGSTQPVNSGPSTVGSVANSRSSSGSDGIPISSSSGVTGSTGAPAGSASNNVPSNSGTGSANTGAGSQPVTGSTNTPPVGGSVPQSSASASEDYSEDYSDDYSDDYSEDYSDDYSGDYSEDYSEDYSDDYSGSGSMYDSYDSDYESSSAASTVPGLSLMHVNRTKSNANTTYINTQYSTTGKMTSTIFSTVYEDEPTPLPRLNAMQRAQAHKTINHIRATHFSLKGSSFVSATQFKLPPVKAGSDFCKLKSIGYYCSVNKNSYLWCFSQSQPPVQNSCKTGLTCNCGFTNDPCSPTYSKPAICSRAAGYFLKKSVGTNASFVGDNDSDMRQLSFNVMRPVPKASRAITQIASAPISDQNFRCAKVNTTVNKGPGGIISTVNGTFVFTSSNHMYPSIRLSRTSPNKDLNTLLDSAIYNDWSAFQPATSSSNVTCPIHPRSSLYLNNPTQMLVQRPTTAVPSGTRRGYVRLPDKQFGLTLAYLMDDYGLNPDWVLSMAGAQSGETIVDTSRDDSYFIGAAWNDDLTCEAGQKEGSWCNLNATGTFNTSVFSMASTFAYFPQRFHAVSNSSTQIEPPTSVNDLIRQDSFGELAQGYYNNSETSLIAFGLDTLWKRNALWLLPNMGYRAAIEGKDEASADILEFAAMTSAAAGSFTDGLPDKLCACPTKPPSIENNCATNSQLVHQVELICRTLTLSSQVYDFPILWADVAQFLETLKSTFPYPKGTALNTAIDWSQITVTSAQAYAKIFATRKQRGGAKFDKGGISYRYDWRTLLAVIRSGLPERENMVGNAWASFVNATAGGIVASDLPVYKAAKKSAYTSPAGARPIITANVTTTNFRLAVNSSDVVEASVTPGMTVAPMTMSVPSSTSRSQSTPASNPQTIKALYVNSTTSQASPATASETQTRPASSTSDATATANSLAANRDKTKRKRHN